MYEAMVNCQRENNVKIYQSDGVTACYETAIRPMTEKMYTAFLKDLKNRDENSLIFKSHIGHKIYGKAYFDHHTGELMLDRPDDIVVDFIASMTDDYFLEAFKYLFPDDPLNDAVNFKGYFGE